MTTANNDASTITAAALIAAFQDNTTGQAKHELLEDFLLRSPALAIDTFALDALTALPRGDVYYEWMLNHISPSTFEPLIAQAVALLERGQSQEICNAAIRSVSMQCPQALQPYLKQLFALRPNDGWDGENWPWRGAQDSDVAFLTEKMRSGTLLEQKKAFECLLETRQPDAIAAAMAAFPQLQLDGQLAIHLNQVDYAESGRPLYRRDCTHLVFPPSYYDTGKGPRALHPCRTLASDAAPVRFGGTGSGPCGYCGQPRHHLVTLAQKYVFTDGGEEDLALEFCLSCMGWECPVMFYQHGADGKPVPLDHAAVTPRFPTAQLRELQVGLATTPPRWQYQSWASIADNINRLGGPVIWVQSADYPDCPLCKQQMHAALVLESGLELDDGYTMDWGSGGLCYGFQCTPCRVIGYTGQCT